MKNDLLRILYGSVVTKKNTTFYLDLYSKNWKEVNSPELIKTLINVDLLELESGNWDTRERHYILNTRYVSYEDGVRHVNLKKFTEKFKGYSFLIVSDKVKQAYFSVKKSLERKYKLEKLNEI